MSETVLLGPYLLDPDNPLREEFTTLHTGGGYAGDINLVTGGYGTVNTVNAPPLPILSQVGSFVQNNMLLVFGIGAILLLSGGKRRR